MDVEIVHDQMPVRLRRARSEQRGQGVREVLLGAGRAEAVADLAGDHIEVGDQGGGAVADVFELGALDAPGAHRLRRCGALERLHAGHLIDAARLDAGRRARRRQPVGLAHIGALGLEVGVLRAVDPAAGAMRLEIGLAQETPDRVRRDRIDDAAFGCRLGQGGVRPMRERLLAVARRLAGQGDDRADLLRGERRRGARAWGIAQPLGERLPVTVAPTRPPALHRRAPDAQLLGRLPHPGPLTSQQNDARARHDTLWCPALAHERLKTPAVFRGDMNGHQQHTGPW